jgi:hypothetical protein
LLFPPPFLSFSHNRPVRHTLILSAIFAVLAQRAASWNSPSEVSVIISPSVLINKLRREPLEASRYVWRGRGVRLWRTYMVKIEYAFTWFTWIIKKST